MIGKTNVGGGGSGSAWAYIAVTYPSGSTCSATNGSLTLSATGTSGLFVFQIPQPASTPEVWTVACANGTKTKSDTVSITTQYQVATVTLRYSRLPEGYQEVEYLQSSGTQYINTGTAPNGSPETWTTEIDISFMILQSAYCAVGGVYYGTSAHYALPYSSGSNFAFAFAADGVVAVGVSIQNVKHNVAINDSNHAVLLDNSTVGTFTNRVTYQQTVPLYLFAAYDTDSHNYINIGSMRIYEFVRKNNTTNEVIQRLIPCYRTSDNVAGMIDLVGGTFYTNAGTGTFTVGADV